jgi:uncharacterized protein (DUF697 family)
MGVSLKLTNLWRVIREVDLQAIRQAAQTPFELVIVDEGDGQAVRLRALLSPDTGVPHPWVRAMPAAQFEIPSNLAPPVAGILITASIDLSPALQSVLTILRRAKVPTVIVMLGAGLPAHKLAFQAEKRLVVPVLDSQTALQIGTALIDITDADLRLALARQLPPLRPAVFDLTIDETARANATYALTSGLAEVVPVLSVPLNLGDMVVLTKNQLIMSYRLVLAAGRDGEPRKLIGEILSVLGGGLLFRQAARQLIGLIPVAGLVPKVAIAYGGTWAIGRAVVAWVTEGREITADFVKTMSVEGVERGRAVAARLVEQMKATGERANGRWERLKAHLPLRGRRGASVARADGAELVRNPPNPPTVKRFERS